ncbi:6-bladed beta-propeller [Gracilimonas mengyeensis]|uniref:6-bladed beta-propeller protein n=1 Tax=Gracilimonas mengyeensis TaxID=1302730 RepID=A0A521BBA7_9BACT|nr:6-bladed beta-propeller [Gracilimonas mengyeensis]SMO44271.1 hypothetical protein SAMN06265219_102143 [Gracilimonas mengyeensis]
MCLYKGCKWLWVPVIFLVMMSCGESQPEDPWAVLERVPEVVPSQIRAFNQADTVFFEHLGYESVVMKNGTVLIADRGRNNLLFLNEEGGLEKLIREGRGPGEVLDPFAFVKDKKGQVYTYDQHNDKILVLDGRGEVVREIIPAAYKESGIIKVFPVQDSLYWVEMMSYAFLSDENKKSEKYLVQYDPFENSYGEMKVLRNHPYARYIEDGEVRGATKVDFGSGHLFSWRPEKQTLLTFDTRTNIIAELDANLDTLKAIRVELPQEELNNTEFDSLRSAYRNAQWKTVEPLLPDLKAKADYMLYHNGEIWLGTHLSGKLKTWLVLNMQGEILRKVMLPREALLTHVSDNHLGLRLDDVTFAFYSNPSE